MEDAEAEAVLLALGGHLEWIPYSLKMSNDDAKRLVYSRKEKQRTDPGSLFCNWLLDRKSTIEIAFVQDGYYSIRARRLLVFPVYTAWLRSHRLPMAPYGIAKHPREFNTLLAAKLGCERHYVTGTWE